MDTFFLTANLAWVVFWAYWLITALMTRSPMKRHQSPQWTRELILIALVWGFCVFYSSLSLPPDILVQRAIPDGLTIGLTGTIIILLGLGFAVWARVHLGKYWSSMPAIRVDHKLIRTDRTVSCGTRYTPEYCLRLPVRPLSLANRWV